MCGRFTLTKDVARFADDLGIRYPKATATFNPRFNVCPSQPVIIISTPDDSLELSTARWGLVPAWAKDPAIGSRLANARCEGIAEKPSFRSSFKRRRCLILSDGFFEWKQGTPKVPFYFRMKDHSVYAFAGLWDEWKDATGQTLRTCCLITTEPNDLLAKVHSRMPVIVKPEDYLKWVSGTEPTELLGLLVPYPADQMEGYPVSTIVNKPQNDSPECIRPI